ncbi:MAG: radical SAM protein [Candidatus Thermoplasmatota archaeon]|nr:radical SAM protein [Candidatus Thermoplasmatota archaeon]MBS3789576.1 radical SAM protein [Candidatus Thermoplasmatota archaeon]
MELGFTKAEIEGVEIKPVSCKTALSKSRLESDYALNPYRGCSHGCKYCYSPCVLREERPWGKFLDVKRNIPNVLSKELKKKKKGMIRIGSVTDPYQEAEGSYELTRRCLEQLSRHDFPILIQTKSGLVRRDTDLLKKIDSDIGFTITTLNEDFRKKFEPNAPPVSERLSAIRELKEEGLDLWVFIGPLFPYLNDKKEDLIRLKNTLKSLGIEEIYLDKLNLRKKVWERIKPLLGSEMQKKYRDIYFDGDDYFKRKKKMFESIGKTVF